MQFSVVVLPKLDNEEEVQLIRERYDPWCYRIRPHITLIPPFTPATLDEIENVSAHLSTVRRARHPHAVTFFKCEAVGDRVVLVPEQGRDELLSLYRELQGPVTGTLVPDAEFEPRLLVGRMPDAGQRAAAVKELNGLRRTLGVVDSVFLIDVESSGELRLVASYPFGIGRVDWYGKLRV